MRLQGKIFEAIRKKPEVKEVLEKFLELEKEWQADDLGAEWHEIPAPATLLNRLVEKGILRITLKTRSSTHYRLASVEETEKALTFLGVEKVEEEGPVAIPFDLFDDVVGYQDIKELFLKGLESRVHFLLVGPPASAKTLFLECLGRLPKSRYVLGSRMTKAGLTDYLITYQPKFLLLDEIDRLSGSDYGVLLSLCHSGRVTEMVYRKTREVTLDTVVFGACNSLKGIPSEVLSRFQVLRFTEYSRESFINVVENVLERRGMEEDLALYIAKQVWDELDVKDPRQAIRISKLAKTREEVDELIEVIKKYRP